MTTRAERWAVVGVALFAWGVFALGHGVTNPGSPSQLPALAVGFIRSFLEFGNAYYYWTTFGTYNYLTTLGLTAQAGGLWLFARGFWPGRADREAPA